MYDEIEILSVEKTDKEINMFDLEVEDNHNFILENNILTHNSGKTVYSRLIIPLFTFNYVKAIGTQVTPNRFLGGPASGNSSVFVPGYAATQDMVFFEECTNALNNYFDTKNVSNINLFSMLKDISDKEYERLIQGSKKLKTRASCVLVGNIEQLNVLLDEYKRHLIKKYRMNGGSPNNRVLHSALFRSCKYYKDVVNDMALARAHSYVRQFDYGSKFYGTGLPEAEQARFAFMVMLEETGHNSKITRLPYNPSKTEDDNIIVHKNEFVAELEQVFKIDYSKVPAKFVRDVEKYFYDEFLMKPNNFNKLIGEELNSHVKGFLMDIIYYYLLFNKLYHNRGMDISEIDFSISDDDKALVEYFLSFNYNSLTMKEAAEVVKPLINDYNDLSKADVLTHDMDRETEIRKDRAERERKEELLRQSLRTVGTDPFADTDDGSVEK